MEEKFYRPKHIEFQTATDGTIMPESLGSFDTPEAMAKFIGANLTAINTMLTVNRHLDNFEKDKIRKDCIDLMENVVPIYERKLSDADVALTEAKKALKTAEENYNAEIAKAKELAYMAKRGLVEMDLDNKFTFRIPFDGNYYFYTWIDKELRLCLVRQIPEHEKQELYNAMSSNESFILNNFNDEKEKK